VTDAELDALFRPWIEKVSTTKDLKLLRPFCNSTLKEFIDRVKSVPVDDGKRAWWVTRIAPRMMQECHSFTGWPRMREDLWRRVLYIHLISGDQHG
jgi:hypothetical protein